MRDLAACTARTSANGARSRHSQGCHHPHQLGGGTRSPAPAPHAPRRPAPLKL